jgi:hypothetical protein
MNGAKYDPLKEEIRKENHELLRFSPSEILKKINTYKQAITHNFYSHNPWNISFSHSQRKK